jgi:small subunit ribosomal protein S6
MSSNDDTRPDEMTDTQLDQLLAAANRELLDRIKATADLHRDLIAIMTQNIQEASDTATVAASVQRWLRTPMRHYEILIILDPSLEERAVQPSLDQFLKVVTDGGGKVDKVDIWGKRRLAYQIQKKSEGFYVVVDLTAEPGVVLELDRQLNLNEAVLRTKVTRPEHHHWVPLHGPGW